ncbi:hypothetical protein NT6N_21440 [Oceaniferula spumae]|uniref:Uncharacterized protein n=1 Tax=Oceaniferula spumae TaxID=2979115 RepID=A0AAT9FM70_9BACT
MMQFCESIIEKIILKCGFLEQTNPPPLDLIEKSINDIGNYQTEMIELFTKKSGAISL